MFTWPGISPFDKMINLVYLNIIFIVKLIADIEEHGNITKN